MDAALDTPHSTDLREHEANKRGQVTAVYLIYLVGLFTALPFLIGVILAYVFRSDAPDWLRSHFGKQIRLFWWGIVVWPVLGFLTMWAGIGFVIMGLSWVWMLVATIKGLKAVGDGRAYG